MARNLCKPQTSQEISNGFSKHSFCLYYSHIWAFFTNTKAQMF